MKSFSPVQYYKDGSKEMRLSLSVTNRSSNSWKQQHHAESHGILERPKYISRYTLFQRAYDTDGGMPTSCSGHLKQKLSLQNKGKVSLHNMIDQSSIAAGRRSRMPAKKTLMTDDLHHRVHPPSTSNFNHQIIDDVKNKPPCHTQFLTYHLEKFPSQHKREALSERKRVASLKLLAQQLVKCLDAADMHPFYLLDGSVQAHAVLLRNNLEKFQRELYAAVKATEGSYSHGSREKCSGYIVLPSKLERSGSSEGTYMKQTKGSQVEGLALMQNKDAFNKETGFLYSDSNSETTASLLFDDSSPQKTKVKQYRVLNKESFKHENLPDSLVAYKENNKAVPELEMHNNLFQDFELTVQSFRMDSKCEPTSQVKRTWDHQLLDKELEKLDAEIKETKSRMAHKLFLTHPLANTSSVTPPLSSSPRCTDNAASLLEGNGSFSATLIHATTKEIVVLPSLAKEIDRLQHVSDAPNELKVLSLDDEISRETASSTLVAKICPEKDVINDVKLKMQEGDMASANRGVDYCKTDVEQPWHAAKGSITSSNTSLETASCIGTKQSSDSGMEEASPTYPSVRKVEVSQVALEPNNARGLTILFKKEMETNQKVLVDIITETLLQELLDYELSDMVLRGRSWPIKKMKDSALESAFISMDAPTSLSLSDTSNSHCRSALSSWIPAHEISNSCITRSSNAYDDYPKYQSYYDFATEKHSSSVIGSPEIHRESFKITSKRLVDNYVEENLEARGLLCSSNLLELYASGKTLSLVLGKQSVDSGEHEEQLYGKMILEAICECLDKMCVRFCLPSFFLFLSPWPEGPHLKKTLISKVNEHADAACEGGFSLEYILEKSLHEEDWRTPYREMVEVLHNISEYVMMDMIDNFLYDMMEVKHLACTSQAAMGLMHSRTLELLHC